MKTQTTRNAALALIGLLALCVYILACTSFSPDDTKVLYPAFDSTSGAIGTAVYDREAHRSEMLCLPVDWEGATNNSVAPMLMRAQWLANGRSILVAWAAGKDESSSLNFALVPWGAQAPFKVFRVPGIKEPALLFVTPLCVAGERVFIKAAPKEVVRLDLKNNTLTLHEFADVDREISLYPAPDANGVFYVEPREQPEKGTVFGRLDPENFSRTPLVVITNEMAGESLFAYDKEGNTVAFLEKVGDVERLVVLRKGQPIYTRPLNAEGAKRFFGSAGIFPRGDVVWATFQKAAGTNTAAYGFLEIPLGDGPIRETILIPTAMPQDESSALYFQASLSHDGKTAAAVSTYLACTEKEFAPENCALFLIDLSDPNRKVTKVPIPVPEQRPNMK